MAETETASAFSEEPLRLSQNNQPHTLLPKVTKPLSRAGVTSKAESRKATPSLPLISQKIHNTLQLKSQNRMAREPRESIQCQFAVDIQQKLKLVLENVNRGQNIPDAQVDEQQDVEFQQLIHQNIQRLKQNKLGVNFVRQRASSKHQQREMKVKSKTVKQKNKNENSIYERRMKQFRAASIQNKYIQKKKESLVIKHQPYKQDVIEKHIQKLKQQKQAKMARHVTSLPKNFKKISSKAKPGHNQSLKSLPNQARTDALFDNIHNLLENPHRSRPVDESRKPNQSLMKTLNEKIREINTRLGLSQTSEYQGVKHDGLVIGKSTVSDWKRLQYNRGSNFMCQQSNFEKEVDRIGSLQERNTDYLTRLMEQQQKLVELSYLTKAGLSTFPRQV